MEDAGEKVSGGAFRCSLSFFDRIERESGLPAGVILQMNGQGAFFCMRIDTKKNESDWTLQAFYDIIRYGILDRTAV